MRQKYQADRQHRSKWERFLSKIKLTIDDKLVEAESGSMVIQAADSVGIYIPRFCYHEKLSIAANCRMCLVEVEKAVKPLPACATPVTDGMVVKTSSQIAIEAQKGTMEFLLINHPLDCPVCDQGGECPLQDQALGYGDGVSRFNEAKRVVNNPDIGALIQTEMTRCIHCTRCVRFGQEVAGLMEFGAIGRGEDMKITTFMEASIDSEVSGNVIDLCPVGALTSKPYRFSARSWEMSNQGLVSPHDCLGSNMIAQSVAGEVKRVLPGHNEEVNECWLSDRDRFSYEAVNSDDRLVQPLIRRGDRMEEATWKDALTQAAAILKETINKTGGQSIGALCTPTATLEEFYLLQKLMRGVGSSNIDHRLRQQDFRDDAVAPLFPGSQIAVSDIPRASSALLVGCNLRKELPLVAIRVRQMVQNGGSVASLNPLRYDANFAISHEYVVEPNRMASTLAGIVVRMAEIGNCDAPFEITSLVNTTSDQDAINAIAQLLLRDPNSAFVMLGQVAVNDPTASSLRAMVSWLATSFGVRVITLSDANSVAGWIAGCLPHREAGGKSADILGNNALEMSTGTLSGCVLYGLEPDLDYSAPGSLAETLTKAETVVSFSVFRSAVPPQADVALPLASFTENSGSYVNFEGRVQFSNAAVLPRGEARPGWKILRVLGNLLRLDGFDYVAVEDIAREIPIDSAVMLQNSSDLSYVGRAEGCGAVGDLEDSIFLRVCDVPLYSVDPTVRRAVSLQKTKDNIPTSVGLSPNRCEQLGFKPGHVATFRSLSGSVQLPIYPDARVLDNCAYIPAGRVETVSLGASQTVWLDLNS